MTTATAAETPPPQAERVYTTADLLAMPDDGVERWLVDGQIREFRGGGGTPMTVRNKHHSRTESRVVFLLMAWLEQQPRPRGAVHSGEAGVVLRDDPGLTVGLDVLYLPPDVARRNAAEKDTTLLVGVPTLAVEILSPSDTFGEIDDRTQTLTGAGVPVVWLVNPYMRTVTVVRPGEPPVTLNETQTLAGDPELPGFAAPVARLFED